MKKLLISILVLGLGAGIQTLYPPDNNVVSDNVLLVASVVTVFEIQDDAGPTYIVCLESATQPSHKMTDRTTSVSIVNSLPEPMTIAMLGLCGFMLGRRRNFRGLLLRNSRRY